jgi:hypothetical protein
MTLETNEVARRNSRQSRSFRPSLIRSATWIPTSAACSKPMGRVDFLSEDDKDWIMGRAILERLGWS